MLVPARGRPCPPRVARFPPPRDQWIDGSAAPDPSIRHSHSLRWVAKADGETADGKGRAGRGNGGRASDRSGHRRATSLGRHGPPQPNRIKRRPIFTFISLRCGHRTPTFWPFSIPNPKGPFSIQKPEGPFSIQKPKGPFSIQTQKGPFSIQKKTPKQGKKEPQSLAPTTLRAAPRRISSASLVILATRSLQVGMSSIRPTTWPAVQIYKEARGQGMSETDPTA